MIFVPWFQPAATDETDPHWPNVTLLVQGGTDASTVINDLSTYADSVTITSDAEFDDVQQVFSNNTLKVTKAGPTIPPFTSTGVDSRFSRPSGEDVTIECHFYYDNLAAVAPSSYMWQWNDSVGGRLAELGTNGTSNLRFRIENNTVTFPALLLPNTLYFLQLTVVGNTYYLDLDGTQVETGTFPGRNNAADYYFYVASSNTPNSGDNGLYWVSPLRVTKGVARSRGAVPAAAFPTSA